jgi:hypothetical protein
VNQIVNVHLAAADALSMGSRDAPPDRCEYPTDDGSPCQLIPPDGEDRCYHHDGLVPECGYPTDNGSPCELPGTRGPEERCHHHHGLCNESLKHDHAAKACFHGMKSAFRFVSSGHKGIASDGYDTGRPREAAWIALEVARAYLQSQDKEYDRDQSQDHYESRIIDDVNAGPRYRERILEDGIEKAWNKIDNENHVGGCRVAIAAAEAFFDQEFGVRN